MEVYNKHLHTLNEQHSIYYLLSFPIDIIRKMAYICLKQKIMNAQPIPLIYNLILSLLTFLLFSWSIPSKKTDVSKTFVERIDSLLSVNPSKPFNGITLIQQEDKELYKHIQGIGDKETGEKLNWDSYFVIGSISKQITAVLIMLEYQQGTIKLNVPIFTYLPNLHQPWAKEVTVHHLLTHTHGITALDKPLNFIPGTQFAYSQIGYQLLADILEEVNNDSFANISARLFKEYEMEHTFHPDLFGDRKLVKSYYSNDKGELTEETEKTKYVAAGGFISTIGDLLRWNKHVFENFDVELYVIRKMFTKHENAVRNHPLFGTTHYGYGFTIDDSDDLGQLGQTGYAPGFPVMDFYFTRSGTSVIILQNVSYGESLKEFFDYPIKVLDIVKDALKNKEIKPYHKLEEAHTYRDKELNQTYYTDSIQTDNRNVPLTASQYYFPLELFPKYKTEYIEVDSFYTHITNKKIKGEYNHFRLKWYSKELYAMQEPLLFNKRTKKEIYRFTWLRSFDPPVCIRIEKENNSYTLFWKLCDRNGERGPGNLIVDKSKKINKSEWERFKTKIEEAKFWLIEIYVNERGHDGAEWIMEGAEPNRYQVISAWCPDESYDRSFYDACLYLLALTDLEIPDKDIY